MMKKLNILLIEDEEADYLLLARHIRKSNLNAELSWVRNGEEMTAAINAGGWDLVLSDYKVSGLDFLETLALLKKRLANVPVILVSGSIGEERAVELLKNGLADFILKDRLFRLIPAIERSLAEEAERRRRREAEAKLIQSEELMRSVLEGTSDVIFVKDREGRYLFFNQAAARFSGRSAAAVIGRDDTVVYPLETAQEIREYDLGIMAAGTAETREEEQEDVNGERRVLLVTKGPVFDSRGQVSGLFGIARDISERKMAERVRQLNLRLLQLVYNQFDIAALLPVFVKEIRKIIGCESAIVSMLDENGSLLHQASEESEPFCSGMECSFPYHPECIMCGRIRRGDIDAAQPYHTPGGSFYLNGVSRFLASGLVADQNNLKIFCHQSGFESVALIPFRSNGKTLGLIHIADRRENKVPLPLVEGLEQALFQCGTIYERNYVQMQLRESESRLRSIIDNANAIIWVKDLEGRFLMANSHLFKLFSNSRKELIGRTVHELFPAEQAREYAANDQKVIETGDSIKVEESAWLEDGLHTFLSVKFPLRDHEGKIYAISAICTDITRMKNVKNRLKTQEQEYRQLSQEYRTLLDNVPDGIIHLTPDLRIRWANAAAQQMFNLEADLGYHGKHCHAAIWEKDERCPSCPVARAITSRCTEMGTFSPEGSEREHELRAVPMNSRNGQLSGIIAIVRDITEHRKLEAQYRQAQKMESIGTLASGIAHDFSNMLSAILGFGELVLDELPDDHTARVNIQTIIEAGIRASRLTSDLLLFSRKQESRKEAVDINQIIIRIEKFIRRIIGEDIQCQTHLASQPLVIFADSHQIDQVLMNLATNARDAMPRGGYLSIITERVELDLDFIETNGFGRPGPHARMTVADTGKGMDKQTAEKIFEPFFTTKETDKGTGLGLAVVYGIITGHQGHVSVHSQPGKGTEFTVHLPLTEEKLHAEQEPAVRQKPRGCGETILLAEDEWSVRKLCTMILEQNGYTVIEAENGEEAVREFEEHGEAIDMVIFDLIMPKKNGKEALEAIHRLRPDVKGFFISGYSLEHLPFKEPRELPLEILAKPVVPRDLLRNVRKILDTP